MKYANAYTYDTSDPAYRNLKGELIQASPHWLPFTTLLYKLGICVLY